MEQDRLEQMVIEIHTDVKWIKCWITEQNKYKLMVYAALVGAILGIIV